MNKLFWLLFLAIVIVMMFEISVLRVEVNSLYNERDLLLQQTEKVDSLLFKYTEYADKLEEVDSLIFEYGGHIPRGSPLKYSCLRINSKFGWRKDPMTKKWAFHKGIDIKGIKWEKVYSTAPGIIKETGYDRINGNYIHIDHGHGYETTYSHLVRKMVRKGNVVKTHSIIGKIGSTGKSTGPHLHYEVIVNGERIDPIHYLY